MSVLPGEISASFTNNILDDLLSVVNPFSPIAADLIFKAAGTENLNMSFAVLPSQYSKDKINQPGYIFSLSNILRKNQSKNVISSEEFLISYLDKRESQINEASFLKAVLVNNLISNWKLKTNDWFWTNNIRQKLWEPLPALKFQAFAKTNGLFPFAAELMLPDFNEKFIQFQAVSNFHKGENLLQRLILIQLSRENWNQTVNELIDSLNEKRIENLMTNFHDNEFQSTIAEIRQQLVNRINNLPDYSEKLFNLVNEYADIFASNEDDIVEVRRLNNNQTSVKISFAANSNESYFYKIFNSSDNRELRIYLLNGNDSVNVSGEVDYGPILRIINQKGKVNYNNSSTAGSKSIFPLFSKNANTVIYDSNTESIFNLNNDSEIESDTLRRVPRYFDKRAPLQKESGYEIDAIPEIDYSSDLGLILGLSTRYTSYKFRTIPFNYQVTVGGGYSAKPNSYYAKINTIFNSFIKGTTVNIDAFRSDLVFTRYYGYGNETNYDRMLEKNNFYKLDHALLRIEPSISFNYWEHTSSKFGLSYEVTDIKAANLKLLSTFPDKDYGLNNFHLLGWLFGLNIDTRNDDLFPKTGFFFDFSAKYFPKWFSNRSPFTILKADARTFLTFDFLGEKTAAFRIGSESVTGKHPFHKSAFLGGDENLRGFNLGRFSGESSIFTQAELRSFLFNWNFITRGKIGLSIFSETGRVFAANENSKIWHSAFGGGFWGTFINNFLVFNATIAFSNERTQFYFGTSMMF